MELQVLDSRACLIYAVGDSVYTRLDGKGQLTRDQFSQVSSYTIVDAILTMYPCCTQE
jgi:hypothetical protein